MIADLERAAPDRTDYDVCVIGAGAAGIALALELRRGRRRVLLLEAGGARYETKSQALYAGETEGLPFAGLLDGRFRVLGGTTTQWGGQILEIDDHVFGPRPWASFEGWPISKADLAPYYRRAVAIEGLEAALDDADAVWLGLSLARPDFGEELVSRFSRWCPTRDLAKLHAAALRDDPDLQVWLHANVVGLGFAEDGQTARKVYCRTLGGRAAEFSAKAFVLCTGGIETSRFLLQPSTNAFGTPWQGNPLIGRHFQDHISAFVATLEDCALQPPGAYFDYQSLGGLRYHPKLSLAPASQAARQTLDICGVVAVTADGQDDLGIAFETYRLIIQRRYNKLSVGRLVHFARHLPTLLWHRLPLSTSASAAGPRRTTLRLSVHCEQAPTSDSFMALSDEKDAVGMRKARLTWRGSDAETHTIRAYIDAVRTAFAANGLGRIVPDPGVMEDDAALVSRFGESFHHIGGARMADTAADGVVDSDLRVFGTLNTYVCSSAVFPSAGFANPTHTVIALAARLAVHLSQKH